MTRRNLFVLLMIVPALVLKAQTDSTIQYVSQADIARGNMLIINSFDVMSSKIRKNKKALFIELTDSLKQTLYEATPAPNGKMIVIPDLVKEAPGSDSTIHSLMVQNKMNSYEKYRHILFLIDCFRSCFECKRGYDYTISFSIRFSSRQYAYHKFL